MPIDAIDNDGWTALHWASHLGHAEAARELLAGGASQFVCSRQGRLPRELATVPEVRLFAGLETEREIIG